MLADLGGATGGDGATQTLRRPLIFGYICSKFPSTYVIAKGSWILWKSMFSGAVGAKEAKTRKSDVGLSSGATREMLVRHSNPRPAAYIRVELFEVAKYPHVIVWATTCEKVCWTNNKVTQ